MIGSTGKSGKFLYYRCSHALRHDADACKTRWLPKNKIEKFITDKLKEKILTDDNLATLVRMVNEEIRLLSSQRRERLEEIGKQLDSVNQKLLKYYIAFESGTISESDAAPRIRELRTEQTRLQKASEEASTNLENTEPKELNTRQVLSYVEDLKALLSTGTLLGQKAILRSFVKRIDFNTEHVAINYTIPMPVEEDKKSRREVLSIGSNGEPLELKARTFRKTFALIY